VVELSLVTVQDLVSSIFMTALSSFTAEQLGDILADDQASQAFQQWDLGIGGSSGCERAFQIIGVHVSIVQTRLGSHASGIQAYISTSDSFVVDLLSYTHDFPLSKALIHCISTSLS
jgi:hypothetical protein